MPLFALQTMWIDWLWPKAQRRMRRHEGSCDPVCPPLRIPLSAPPIFHSSVLLIFFCSGCQCYRNNDRGGRASSGSSSSNNTGYSTAGVPLWQGPGRERAMWKRRGTQMVTHTGARSRKVAGQWGRGIGRHDKSQHAMPPGPSTGPGLTILPHSCWTHALLLRCPATQKGCRAN